MAKKYIAIGLDNDGDVLANEVAQDTEEEAKTTLFENFENVVLHHVLEITVPDPAQVKVKTTKLTIG